mmetsp:Transcript_86109/g.240787  ORF Transcript_86109/g.240787 Transcript_86109/m.240787 type:complete len:208 (+) Transcript_86109:1269-1892(+)
MAIQIVFKKITNSVKCLKVLFLATACQQPSSRYLSSTLYSALSSVFCKYFLMESTSGKTGCGRRESAAITDLSGGGEGLRFMLIKGSASLPAQPREATLLCVSGGVCGVAACASASALLPGVGSDRTATQAFALLLPIFTSVVCSEAPTSCACIACGFPSWIRPRSAAPGQSTAWRRDENGCGGTAVMSSNVFRAKPAACKRLIAWL